MKIYQKKPLRDVIIVKPDADDNEYEFWIITPVKIGGARKVGTQRIITDDNQQFTNLNSAARYLLEQISEKELAAGLPLWMKRDSKRIEVVGLDLIESGKWTEFCKLRKMDVRNTEAMGKRYFVTQDEAKQLRIKV